MAASDNLHPGQLKMFMRPDELLGSIRGSVEAGTDPRMLKATMKEKLERADMKGTAGAHAANPDDTLHNSIAAEGVHAPVILSPGDTESEVTGRWKTGQPSRSEHFWLGNGHHRVAAAQKVEQQTGREQYIPVIYDDDFMGSPKTRQSFPGVPAL